MAANGRNIARSSGVTTTAASGGESGTNVPSSSALSTQPANSSSVIGSGSGSCIDLDGTAQAKRGKNLTARVVAAQKTNPARVLERSRQRLQPCCMSTRRGSRNRSISSASRHATDRGGRIEFVRIDRGERGPAEAAQRDFERSTARRCSPVPGQSQPFNQSSQSSLPASRARHAPALATRAPARVVDSFQPVSSSIGTC